MLPNLFEMATKVIPPETIQYYHFTGDEINSIGKSVPTYADPIDVKASVQPVGDDFYKALGLDFQKEYYYVYSNQRMYGINEQNQPDCVAFHGHTYMVHKNCHWDEYNGWGYVMVVKDEKRESNLG